MSTLRQWLSRARDIAWLRGVIFGGLFLAALYLLHLSTAQIHWRDVAAAFAATPWWRIGLALALTGMSFVALGAYDVVALAAVAPGRVPWRVAAIGGMISYAFSNALGFHVLTGGSIRYRLYSRAGLELADIGRMVAISIVTLWLGVATLVGLGMVLDPEGIPVLDKLGPRLDRILGVVAILVVFAFVTWLARSKRSLTVAGWTVHLPGGTNAFAQIAIGTIDVASAAGALYVLLPPELADGFAYFLMIFVVALALGMISHSPGGLGVFEATIAIGLGVGGSPELLAALLAFRVIYYLVPLAVAALGLGVLEAGGRLSRLGAQARVLRRALRPGVPPLMGGLAFLGGVILLVSGNLPAIAERTAILGDFVPLPFADASHLFASVVGLALLGMARGLARRIAIAQRLTMILLLAGAAFSLGKGLDYEEALVLLVLAGLLWLFSDAFYRKGNLRDIRPTPGWMLLGFLALVVTTWIGILAYRHVDLANEPWWQVAWDGDAPRFIRATLAVVVIATAVVLDGLINRLRAQHAPVLAVPDEIRPILARWPETQANVALLGDKRFMLAEKGGAFVMYGVVRRSWITMGPPVGEKTAAIEMMWRFVETADRAGARAVFYAVPASTLPAFLDLGYSLLKIGEVASVDLAKFSLEGPTRQDFRYAYRRAEREGLSFEVLPKAAVPGLIDELRSVSDAWLTTKHGKEKGFSLGRFDARYLAEFDCAVLRKEGALVAFANLWRGAEHNEISVDLMRYRAEASRVLMDALFAHLLLYAKKEGYRWFNLGATPLAGLKSHPLASTWNQIGTLIYKRGDEIYNFEGLRAFKQKFDPVWSPQYIACPGGLAIPAVLLDIATLISGGTLGVVRR